MKQYAQEFGLMAEKERGNAVRSMVLALSATAREIIKLEYSANPERNRRGVKMETYKNTSTVYAIKGQNVSDNFAAIVQMHVCTISRFAFVISNVLILELFDYDRPANHPGHLS